MPTTTPNYGWSVPVSTDLVKDGAVAIETLGDSIDASLVDLRGGTTGQVLAKATDAQMDFAWVTQDDANAIQNAIVDAKGDLIGATAADTPARLAVGANDTVLTADSSTATGLKWAAPASTDSMVLLSTTNITNVTSIAVSVAGGYQKLVVYVENFAPALVNDTLLMRFNNDSSSNYDAWVYQANYGDLTPLQSHPGSFFLMGQVNNINTSSNGLLVLELPNYAATNCTKLATGLLSAIYGSTTNIFHSTSSLAYRSTSAITTINLGWGSGSWKAQGTIKVYGVK